MNKRVGDIEEFEFETLCEEGDLNVTIAISGWITENEPGELIRMRPNDDEVLFTMSSYCAQR